MPGWSHIPVAAGDDMQLLASYLELMGAWNERRAATGASPITNPAAGDTCFEAAAAYSIPQMQAWVEAHCTDFVVSHDAGSPPTLRGAGYYDSASSIDFYTLASFRATAGLNASGFTRTDSPTYGNAVAGDIVLKEHFNELRLAFNVLRWTLLPGGYDSHGESNSVTSQGNFKTTALLAYNDVPWPGVAVNSGGNPQAVCIIERSVGGGSDLRCTLTRAYQYGEFSGISTALSHSMEVYQRTMRSQTVGDTEGFDDNGDDLTSGNLYQEGLYRLIQSFALANTATRTTHKIGQAAAIGNQPHQSATPPAAPVTSTTAILGWEATPPPAHTGGTEFPQGLIKWDMTYT